MNFATSLTIARIFVGPVFLSLYLYHDQLGISELTLPYSLLLLMIVSELSDAFDGYVARKYNHVTDLGKLLDPMADSIARISIFLTFTLPPVSLPMILIFIFLYRDSMVGTLRTICALRGHALAARPSGKLKAVIQATCAFAILIMMIPHSLGMISTETLQSVSFWLVLTTGIYSVLSGLEYIFANRKFIDSIIHS